MRTVPWPQRGCPILTWCGHFERALFSQTAAQIIDRNFFQIAELVAPMNDVHGVATPCAYHRGHGRNGDGTHARTCFEVLVCGGRHNPVIMSMQRAGLGVPVHAIEQYGLNGDMLEAQAFACLAARVLNKRPTSGPSTTGAPVYIGGGMWRGLSCRSTDVYPLQLAPPKTQNFAQWGGLGARRDLHPARLGLIQLRTRPTGCRPKLRGHRPLCVARSSARLKYQFPRSVQNAPTGCCDFRHIQRACHFGK